MEKMNLPLQQFLTLVSPAQEIVVIDEEFEQERGDKPLFSGKGAKMRDKPELLKREVKLIAPAPTVAGAAFWIWIY